MTPGRGGGRTPRGRGPTAVITTCRGRHPWAVDRAGRSRPTGERARRPWRRRTAIRTSEQETPRAGTTVRPPTRGAARTARAAPAADASSTRGRDTGPARAAHAARLHAPSSRSRQPDPWHRDPWHRDLWHGDRRPAKRWIGGRCSRGPRASHRSSRGHRKRPRRRRRSPAPPPRQRGSRRGSCPVHDAHACRSPSRTIASQRGGSRPRPH